MTAEASSRARRLERLRALDHRLQLAAELPAPSSRTSARSRTSAEQLADALGGRVVGGEAGRLVITDAELDFP
ncbi:MAG TPA: hypothetical protein VK592_02830, partial [Candidatus Dormibacteraeota bacterium]|nr:hypothetical protein [Candidatus Dormibacteraeota bacterium]